VSDRSAVCDGATLRCSSGSDFLSATLVSARLPAPAGGLAAVFGGLLAGAAGFGGSRDGGAGAGGASVGGAGAVTGGGDSSWR